MTSSPAPSISAGAVVNFGRTRIFWMVLSVLAIATVISTGGAWSDFSGASDDERPQLLVLWALLSVALISCFIAIVAEKSKVVPSGAELVCGMYSAGTVFFVALYASTSWPSEGLVPGLGITTVAIGTSAILIRLRVRRIAELEASETAAILGRLRDEWESRKEREKPDTADGRMPCFHAPMNLPFAMRLKVAVRVIANRAHVVQPRDLTEVSRP